MKILAYLAAILIALCSVEAQELKNVALKESAATVRDDQVKTLMILDGALEKLRSEYKSKDTTLSQEYESWKGIYNKFGSHFDKVDADIAQFEKIANDLFAEWKQEAESMNDSNLKSRSLSKLIETQSRYEEIQEHLAERRVASQKITTQLKDRVLFIKHSLNAESLEILREEASDIESDMEDMRDEMETALKNLNSFIGTLS